jgi:predicted metal-dependent phosphoesterase TrpH
MADLIDLHLHTTHSDGILTPAQLLDEVRTRNLAAFAVTDHDTIDGYLETRTLLQPGDPELVSGVELSVGVGQSELHLLAYLVDPENEALAASLTAFQKERNRRGRRMVEKLNELGIPLEFDQVLARASGAVVGRPHVAEAMVKQGLVSCFEAAFRDYIGNQGPAYVPKSRLQPREAIELVHQAGGVAVLAHPFINEANLYIDELIELNLDGLEVNHYSHSKQQVRELKRLAKRHGLARSGGSDFHGRSEHEGEIGVDQVPVEYLDDLKRRALEIRGRF